MFENLFPALPSKNELRARLKKELVDLQGHDRQVVEDDINKVLTYFMERQSGKWGAYRALAEEINIDKAVRDTQHIQWSFPVTDENDNMKFYKPGPQGFHTADYGILEPILVGASEMKLPKADGLLIPGLGYDVNGYRLGRGKGFFDKALANFNGLKVGISFSKCLLEELPVEAHDARVDLLITEKGILHFTK